MMNHVISMVRAYMQIGTAEVPPLSSLNAARRYGIEAGVCFACQAYEKAATILTAWLTAGRTAESAFISWDNTFYDDYFQCAYIAIYQWKVDEEKLIPFVAGGCMWLCW